MASFGSVVLRGVVLWFGSCVILCSSLAILADSGTVRCDEAIDRSLLKNIKLF